MSLESFGNTLDHLPLAFERFHEARRATSPIAGYPFSLGLSGMKRGATQASTSFNLERRYGSLQKHQGDGGFDDDKPPFSMFLISTLVIRILIHRSVQVFRHFHVWIHLVDLMLHIENDLP
jgi:hypothetical protein